MATSEKRLRQERLHRKQNKEKVLGYYSKFLTPMCAICMFDDIRALSLDHVDNTGAEHRRKIGRSSNRLYVWIIKNNYPSNFQVLCFNCQMIKRYGADGYVNDSVNIKYKKVTDVPASQI